MGGWGQVVVIEINLVVLTSRQSAPRAYEIHHSLGAIHRRKPLEHTAHYGDLSPATLSILIQWPANVWGTNSLGYKIPDNRNGLLYFFKRIVGRWNSHLHEMQRIE